MSRDDIPRSLTAVLQKGMASDRADRFATAVDFARALQRVEMELGYAPTTIEVPNLLVAAPDRDSDGDSDDETKVRTVATIEAQPDATPPSTPEPVGVPSSEPTLLRGATPVIAQPEVPAAGPATELPTETVVRRREPVAPPPAATAPPQRRTGRMVGWIIGVLAVLVAGGVAAAIIFGGPVLPADPEASSSPSGGGAVVVESIPTPQLAGAPTAEGSNVTFTFTNPDPVDGDKFTWRITNRTDSEPLRTADGDSVTIDDYASGSTVCIQVSILRSGKLSANPYETCYPA
jgi:hypothetical protein